MIIYLGGGPNPPRWMIIYLGEGRSVDAVPVAPPSLEATCARSCEMGRESGSDRIRKGKMAGGIRSSAYLLMRRFITIQVTRNRSSDILLEGDVRHAVSESGSGHGAGCLGSQS